MKQWANKTIWKSGSSRTSFDDKTIRGFEDETIWKFLFSCM